MDKIFQDLFKKFSKNTIYIVGGGHSLKEFDFSLLKNKNTIAINDAAFSVPDPTIVYWTDDSWLWKRTKNIPHFEILSQEKYKNSYMFMGRNTNHDIKGKYLGLAHNLKINGINGLGNINDFRQVHGNNSGAHCISFSCKFKPKRIVLLGFDMNVSENKETHFHGRKNNHPDVYPNMFIPSISSMSKGISELNINVVNANINSSLKCFKKIKLEDIELEIKNERN